MCMITIYDPTYLKSYELSSTKDNPSVLHENNIEYITQIK